MAALKQPISPDVEEAVPASIENELVDVPATVVCATCGDPACPGCSDRFSLSGIVSVVPWERPGAWTQRFWTTARAASFEGESFFERLPEGSLGAAFGFALIAEIFAIASFAVLWSSVAVALIPAALLAELGGSRLMLALRYAPASTAIFVATLLLAHTLHALGLAYGAYREGRPLRLARALRFGFYSTSWDVVMSPFGLLMTLVTERGEGLARIRNCLTGLPTRCSVGFLRGVYRLDGAEAHRALMVSYVAAVIATVLASGLIVAGALAAVFG